MNNIVSQYTNILRRHHTLGISMGLYFAWLLYFPMGHGLATLSQGLHISFDTLMSIFLMAHFLGLIACGLWWHKVPRLNSFMHVFLVILLLYSFAVVLLPGPWLPYITALAGLASSPYIISWATRYVAETKPGERCKTVALNMSISNLVVMLLTAASPLISLKWLAFWGCVPVLLLIIYLFKYPPAQTAPASTAPGKQVPTDADTHQYWPGAKKILLLTLLLIAFYLTAGYLYDEIYRKHASLGGFIFSYSFLPSIIGIVAAGYLGDLYERKLIANIGLALLGISIVVFPVSSGLGGFLATETLIQMAYSFIDLFLWVTLATLGLYYSTHRAFGLGLGLNVGIIWAGIKLNSYCVACGYQSSMPLFLLVVIFMGLAFLYGYADIKDPRQKPQANPDQERLKTLTPREKDVARLILKGKSNKDIAAALGISENTIKTHIRNILQKAAVPNKLKFISKYHRYL